MNKARKKSAVSEPEEETGRKGSRLAEWSRRKAAARSRAGIEADEGTVDRQVRSLKNSESNENDVPITTEVKESGPALQDADMPPLESLDENSDYSGFLSPGVSEKLRKRALRKLFHLEAYNLTDGLDDYAEDYTNFAALGNILTSDLRLRKQREADALNEELLNAETSPEPRKEEQSPGAEAGSEFVPETMENMDPEEDNTEIQNQDQV